MAWTSFVDLCNMCVARMDQCSACLFQLPLPFFSCCITDVNCWCRISVVGNKNRNKKAKCCIQLVQNWLPFLCLIVIATRLVFEKSKMLYSVSAELASVLDLDCNCHTTCFCCFLDLLMLFHELLPFGE